MFKEDFLPFAICVLMPVLIVLIIALTKMYGNRCRSQVIIKAIEANNELDTEKLVDSLHDYNKSAREILNRRLLRGCIFSLVGVVLCIIGLASAGGESKALYISGGISLAIGISFLIVYFVTRDQVDSSAVR